MNIVKGVADLIRRSSSGHTGESPGSPGEMLSPPTPRIRFSEVDDEAVLSSLWERYENTADKEEKKRMFHVFLKQFLIVFKNWEPVKYGQLPEAASTAIQPGENSTSGNDIVGCFAGHPSEIILTLTEEIMQITTLVSEINTSAGRTTTDLPAATISFIITSEGLPVLYALKIIARSLHNCRVFSYYDGIQKLTALMKGAVIQLKTMTGSLSVDENFSNFLTEKIGFLQRLLVYVVSIMCSLIDLDSNIYEKAQMYNITEGSYEIGASSSIDSSNSLKGSLSETRLHWHQKAIVSVMEAGGLNWLVELMRVMRRLSMKEQWTDMPLQCLTLRTLCVALSNNSRGQNHFKSIGGLEVLLDGLALPPINMLLLKSDSNADGPRVFINTLQHCVLKAFKKILTSSPTLLEVFRKAGIWDLIFSENFFYLGSASEEPFKEISTYNEGSLEKLEKYSSCWSNVVQLKDNGVGTIQREVITFVELVATSNGSLNNLPELSALIKALEQCACNPEIASVLAKSLLQILQQSVEKTIASFNSLNAVSRVLKVACILAQESKQSSNISFVTDNNYLEGFPSNGLQRFDSREIFIIEGTETCMEIFKEFFSVADDVKSLILHDSTCIDCLFELFWEEGYKNHVLKYILDLMKVVSLSGEDRNAMLYVCSKYLETFNLIKEKEQRFAELSINLLNGMMDILQTDLVHYQALFRDGGCFLHVVSLLNGTLDEAHGEMLVLVVLQTLTSLLARNDASKEAFRALVGKGYQTLQSLLLDFCQWHPSEALLNALLDMLVDGKFDIKDNPHIKSFCHFPHGATVFSSHMYFFGPSIQNEDVIILCSLFKFDVITCYFVIAQSSESLRHYGLGVFQQLLRDSLSNRASCVVAGMLNFLLDWFVQEGDDSVILKIAQLIQVIGGYSISGKDIRKIFALLRSEKVGTQLQYCSLLLTTVLSMLNEKGPTTFFDLNGNDSGIIIKTPVHWPLYKGFSFSCWLRVEDFPKNGTMGLFNFFTENRRGFLAAVAKDKLLYKSINLKQYSIQTHVNLIKRKWHFLCITHTIGRAFSGGSLFRCYLDGNLVSSERCRYAKVSELLTNCSIGTKMVWPQSEDNTRNSNPDFLPFFGQIGPLYLFADVISSEQVKAVFSLGPSYMYSFLDNEATAFGGNPLPSGILEAKDGLASKIVFGLNAQASDGKKLFNVSPVLEHALDKNLFEATIKVGTQLCSRRLFKEIIYCVGGVSVFFPLISQSDRYENDEIQVLERTLVLPVAKERLTAEVIELVASVLDENLANQQQMHLLSGFSILGFLFQSVPPQQLNMETLSALKNLFNVVSSCGLAELLIEEIISSIFLNPLTWLYTVYKVQRELYMFLIEQFDNDPRLLKSLCQFPRVIDIIRQCYWDNVKSRFAIGGQPLLHPITKQIIGERPSREEIKKIRLLLLSLGEMSLRQSIAPADIKALIAFFETSNDMTCIEDILNMVIRAVSQKPLLMSFLEQVNLIGGCRIFVNLLQREYEPIRLLSLQFIGRLLVGFPSEKKATRFFNLAVGRTKPLSENNKKVSSRLQPLFSVISDRLFKFPQTDNLCATLFDVLLGGASPKQVLQKNSTTDKQRSRGKNSHFFLPQMLVLIFRFLSGCKDASARMKIISDLLELLDSNTLNIEALMGGISCQDFLYDIYDNLIQRLVDLSSEENIFSSQPCRDNTLYFLRLVDEMLISEAGIKLLFPAISSDSFLDSLMVEGQKDYTTLLHEVLRGEFDDKVSGNALASEESITSEDDITNDKWWNLFDNLWIVISEMNGKGPSKMLPRITVSVGPSFGQRARDLVESLNIPATEMAAVVISGGFGNALSGKQNKVADKAMALRGERCPRIVFRLLIIYLCRASLERASRCVQQFISLLPSFLGTDDEQSKSRLQLFIWSLLLVRSRYGKLDDGARFHVIAHVIRETVNSGKSMLATSMIGRDDLFNTSSLSRETGSLHNLIQKDRVLSAVTDESKYVKMLESDRSRHLQELRAKMDENSSSEINTQKTFEDEIQSSLHSILASDESRRAAFLLAHEEEQQNVAEKWMHMFRTLIDERGPWSANPFPNGAVIHWKLDKTEDTWRRRPKLRQNYHFDEKLCHPPSTSPCNEATLPSSESKPSFVGHIPEQMKKFLLKGVHRITDDGSSEPAESGAEPDDPSDIHNAEIIKSSSDQIDIVPDRKELSSPSQETETSEVLMSVPCVLVAPKRKLAGRLAVMKDVLHFFGEFLVEGTVGSSVFKSLNESSLSESAKADHKPKSFNWSIHLGMFSDKGTSPDNMEAEDLHKKELRTVKRHRRWNIGKIKAVHWTRYLLGYNAVEIFFSDSIAPIFINFASQKNAKEIGTLIVSTRNELLFPRGSSRDKSGIISFVDRRVAVEMAETARERWKRRDITNFDYLMILNTLSGRSYNDLSQYPVFPWVLADYSSEVLDFNKSATFRDLSKPVGALDSKRFEVFEDRYQNFCDPDIPNFYYGSHYSSMGIVLYYLLRMEPFSYLHRNFQGGKFDHADRLFQCIEGTYKNCLSNTSDVKELIPEFFYMPEFLINSNSYHLGVKQDGELISDVSLPPWAKGSPELFVSKNREALESEYVSSNLHHWIDLIFGYKQRGKPAVEAANIFYYLTYEGAVDLDTMDDDLQRSAIEDQIANFGQTPIQIFCKRHPRRGPPIPIAHPLSFAPASISLTSILSCMSNPPSAVLYVGLLDSNIVIVNQGLTLSVKMWLTTQLQFGGNFTFSGSFLWSWFRYSFSS
ncbi:hypothetical protein ERO13_A06G031500v2 [Gossypium hirsutum]|nr:hypothetical protein ERO13_A06G031500v2 [Gossypium hirsutum]